ncbi:ATP-dependent DNA helicase PIF1 [Aphelenchoides avenae]|nr:ATP-dependent DNA helicase PIF1 [Aphelenchus avenae]
MHSVADEQGGRVYNEQINEAIPGNFRYYHSIDAVAVDTANQGIDVPADVLNKVDVSGLPPHELALKVCSVMIIIRNMDVPNGLVNGQRFLVTKMCDNCLQLMFLSGSRVGQTAFVHRVKLYSDDQDYPFVGLDLHEECFGHGMLYTGISRATSSKNVKVLLHPSKAAKTARNIVQKEIFRDY